MDFQFVSEFEPALTALEKFRRQYALASSRTHRPNLCELAILVERGGRRVPTWLIRDYSTSKRAIELFETLEPLTREQVFDCRERIKISLVREKVVPKTRSQVFATFLSIKVCVTPENLSLHAGVSLKTARVWIRKAARASVIQLFESSHEIFGLNLNLMSLAVSGIESNPGFIHERQLELRELRLRTNWLESSRIAAKFPDFRR